MVPFGDLQWNCFDLECLAAFPRPRLANLHLTLRSLIKVLDIPSWFWCIRKKSIKSQGIGSGIGPGLGLVFQSELSSAGVVEGLMEDCNVKGVLPFLLTRFM